MKQLPAPRAPDTLGEIVVAAQKRAETILAVPISITEFGQDALDRRTRVARH